MKVAVVGCGALGSFYGAKLCRAGHEVHFLLRSDYDTVCARGVTIHSVDGNFHVQPICVRVPEAIGLSDLVLIGLKTTANHEFSRLLPPLVGQGTLVVTLQNGLGNEEQLAALLGPDNIMGGLCFVCLNRIEPGLIVHSAHGKIVLGEFQRPPLARTARLAEVVRQAGVTCVVSENLAAAHWEKLVWNIPFNGLGVAGAGGYESVLLGVLSAKTELGPCLPTDALLRDPRWEQLARDLMCEVVTVARAKGFAIPNTVVEEQIARTRVMSDYKASTLLDFERGLPLEMESMFMEPLRQARATGVAAPRLAALCTVLAALETRNVNRVPMSG